MENPPQDRQRWIEARAAQWAGVTPRPDQTMRDVFGEMDDWIFELGAWKFLLDPVSRRWLYLDFAHDQYVDTGYSAGEVLFELAEVAFTPPPRPRVEAQPPQPAPAVCSGCGAALQPGWRFCGRCRTPIAPQPAPAAPRTCAHCGAAALPDARFCGNCGQAL